MRETAWRVFAEEFNNATYEIKGGEKQASYVVTPLGAKISRLFIVGVLTEKETVGENMLRARISDPTGVFTVYAGQYQPLAAQKLTEIEPPAFVAVIGKSKTYSPEENVVYTSVRPEIVKEVDADVRDAWVVETCRHMRRRIEAVSEALKMNPPTIEKLTSLGFNRNLTEGVMLAVENYGNVDVEKYSEMLIEALKYLLPGSEEIETLPQKQEVITEEKKETEDEKKIVEMIEALDTGKGASWEKILEMAEENGMDKDRVEEAVNSLMDKGIVYEPILGRLKKI
ncbi:MAG: hypothetical protein KKE04_02950 [Candidatus Thermoplasmatota archaeon]|nr:hypothetical protein [Candidatus Thermoplasmatota archaeon]